jgi:hypothetical protein
MLPAPTPARASPKHSAEASDFRRIRLSEKCPADSLLLAARGFDDRPGGPNGNIIMIMIVVAIMVIVGTAIMTMVVMMSVPIGSAVCRLRDMSPNDDIQKSRRSTTISLVAVRRHCYIVAVRRQEPVPC